MSTYNPLHALLIFIGLSILIYFLFRPAKGWFWIIKNHYKTNEKIVIEDILKLLFHSENDGKILNTNDLTRLLNFDNSLILSSIQKMTANSFILLEGEQLKLQPAGREYALRIIRMHRLWEKFLAEKTGYDKSEWHERAEQKEHELNTEETNILASKLGNPQFDPHGDPIPSNNGKMATVNGVPLSTLPINTVGKIIHIEDEPEIIYKQILAENIHIGSHIRVIENNATRVSFLSEGEEFKLAPIVAGNLTISILKKDRINEDNITRLSSLKENETATIIGISKESRGENRRRLLDLGFVKGATVNIDLLNPLGEPNAYLIKGTAIALRNNQASKILIKKITNGYKS
jgi:DtxR family Mn-dependent transcriptional regulator